MLNQNMFLMVHRICTAININVSHARILISAIGALLTKTRFMRGITVSKRLTDPTPSKQYSYELFKQTLTSKILRQCKMTPQRRSKQFLVALGRSLSTNLCAHTSTP